MKFLFIKHYLINKYSLNLAEQFPLKSPIDFTKIFLKNLIQIHQDYFQH